MKSYKIYVKVCECCGTEFIAKRKDKRYCCRTCKDIAIKLRNGERVNANPKAIQKVCVVCGKTFETRRDADVCCSPECSKKHRSPDLRYSRSWEEYVAEVKAKAEARKAEKEKENATANAVRIIWAIAEKRKDKYCAECGGVFHSEYPNKIYCSDRCKRKHRDRLRPKRRKNHSSRSIRSRCRKYGVYYDPSVKSELAFKRDEMVCQICGEKCDPKDHTWGSTGPLYPSVDHIIPLAKGGTHTWGNVQTAHIICNSFKCDSLGEEASCG